MSEPGINLKKVRPGQQAVRKEFEKANIFVKLDEIINFEDNPRFVENAEYMSILDSLRESNGFKGAFEATKRPGDNHFITYRGGGTRLKALNQLYNETNDETFNTLELVVLPYPGEAKLIANHLRENEDRADLRLVEKALAALKLKEVIESETGNRNMDDLAFVSKANELGYRKIVRQRMNLYRFVKELYGLLPTALQFSNDNAGMGRPQVEEIQRFRHALDALGEYFKDENMAETVWLTVLPDMDSETLTAEELEAALIACITEQRNMDIGDAYGLFNRAKNREPLVHEIASNDGAAPSVSKKPKKRPILSDLVNNCIDYDKNNQIKSVRPPEIPFDRNSDTYPADCLSWHLISRLETSPDQKTLLPEADESVGPLSSELINSLDTAQLAAVCEGFVRLYKQTHKKS